MYFPEDIEDVCFEPDHVKKVLVEIRKHLPDYFNRYIETEAGKSISHEAVAKIANGLKATAVPTSKRVNKTIVLKRILAEAIKEFEDDRKDYQDILDLEALEEYGSDPSSFKNTIMRNQCPIIRRTLQNKSAKKLDRYRQNFQSIKPSDLFNVTHNIATLANDWNDNWYDGAMFERIRDADDLNYHQFDDEEYTAYGVIGGGIKSHFCYKLFPHMYPNRSREGVWSLWYLTNKQLFGCKQDSEFLMIDEKDGTTQQNYFYPYGLFSYYAHQIYMLLKEEYAKHAATIPVEYRFVAVDSFLSFVARCHQDEINTLTEGYGEHAE